MAGRTAGVRTNFVRNAKTVNKSMSNNEEDVKTGVDIDMQSSSGLTGLHLACKEGHTEIVEKLIKHGANVNLTTKVNRANQGNTALHIASFAGNLDIVKLLVENGANINAQSQNGSTALYLATQENNDKIVAYLLQHGADISLPTKGGSTALQLATERRYRKIISLLSSDNPQGRKQSSKCTIS